jgi:hypothetical protein
VSGIACFLHREILNDDGQGHVDYQHFVEMGSGCDACRPAVVYPVAEAEALEAAATDLRGWVQRVGRDNVPAVVVDIVDYLAAAGVAS